MFPGESPRPRLNIRIVADGRFDLRRTGVLAGDLGAPVGLEVDPNWRVVRDANSVQKLFDGLDQPRSWIGSGAVYRLFDSPELNLVSPFGFGRWRGRLGEDLGERLRRLANSPTRHVGNGFRDGGCRPQHAQGSVWFHVLSDASESVFVLGLELKLLEPRFPLVRFVVAIEFQLSPLRASVLDVYVPVVVQLLDFTAEFLQSIRDFLGLRRVMEVFAFPIGRAIANQFIGHGRSPGGREAEHDQQD